MPAGDTLANRHTLLAAPTLVIAHGMCQCIQWLSMFGVARRGRLRAPGGRDVRWNDASLLCGRIIVFRLEGACVT